MTDSPFKEETKEKTILRADAAVEALDADDVDGSVDGRSINAQRIVAGDVHSESSQSVESDLESSNGFKSVEPEPGSSNRESDNDYSNGSNSAQTRSETSRDSKSIDASAKSSQNIDPEALPDLGERFEVIARIGRGGMGSVYKVRDRNIDAILAVKVLQPNLVQDQAALKRFEQEAEAARKLSHPNLVSVYDHGTTDDGAPYIVMDYLEGRALADILNDAQTLESRRAIRIFKDICEALSYAHKQGVIHRDIKPTNIIVTDVGLATERAHIVDFGIAKVLPSANRETHDLTQTGEIFGSPHYMSPEQCLGFMLDNRSDIYSLGCLMYEALTGATPFDGANPIQVVVKHMNEQPAEFSRAAKVDKLVEKLENVAMRCLDKEKTERYQNVDDVINDLNAIEAGKSVAKYAQNARVKPMFTKRQTLGILVIFVGVTIYGTIFSMTVNSEFGGRILGGLITLVCLAGVYVFYSAALEVFKKRIKVLTESNAWRILLLLSLGTGSLTAAQYPTLVLVGFNHFPREEIVRQLFFGIGIVHVFALISCAIAGLGCLLFRSPKKFNPLTLAAKYVAVGAAITMFCGFVVPEETGKVLTTLARASTHEQPVIAKMLHQTAYQLGKDKNKFSAKDHLSSIAELDHTLGNHEAELAYYEKIGEDSSETYRLPDLATRFKTHNQPVKAMMLIDKAVTAARDRKDATDLARTLSMRDQYHQERNELKAAQTDLREAIQAQPRMEENMRSLAKLDCILGDFNEASQLMEKVCEVSGLYAIEDRILAGILADHLGNIKLANSHYQAIVDQFQRDKSTRSQTITQYAIDRLGLPLRATYDQKPIRDEDKASFLVQLGIEKSKLPINWSTAKP